MIETAVKSFVELSKSIKDIKESVPTCLRGVSEVKESSKDIYRPVCEKPYSDPPRYLITRNEGLENDKHPFTGVLFEKRIIEVPNGERVEGVFPRFEAQFEARIPEDMYLQPDKVQFRECNRQLAAEIERNPDLKEKFSKEQIEQIKDGVYDGTAPDGYVWHHDAEAGKLQLVDFETHSHTGHTGGRSIWGGGTDNR